MLAALIIFLAGGAVSPEPIMTHSTDPTTYSISSETHGFGAAYFALASGISSLSEIDFAAVPDATGTVDRLNYAGDGDAFWSGGPTDNFAAHYAAALTIETAGSYAFYLTSDDGSAMLLDGARVIDNDGPHASIEQTVTLDLDTGIHMLDVLYFENNGGQVLALDWAGRDTGGARTALDGAALAPAEPAALVEPAPANTAPVATDDAAETGAGAATTVDVLANDTDGDGDALEILELGDPANGSVALVDGGVSYTPDAGFDGADSFTYTAGDGQGATVTVAPAPPPPLQTDDLAQGLVDPLLAMGLNGISDWSVQQPFIDVMKTARSWTGHSTGQWGAISEADLRAGGHLDADGWLRSLPDAATSISSFVLTDLPETASTLAGRYRLTYEGEGELSVLGQANNVQYADGEIWFDFTPGTGGVGLNILKTDPNNHIRDISIVKEANIALHEAGVIFNPDWVELVEDLRTLRFMDWMNTNNSDLSEWSDRPQATDYSYTPHGAPVEIMVALANEIGADPWFTMPHRASDEYVRNFATYVHENLDPQLKAHVEYSNEVWNWQFDQAQWAGDQARDRWGAEGDAWMQFVGMRAAQVAQIWDDTFGAEADQRLVKVIATHTGWLGLEEAMLEAPLWVAEDPANQPPAKHFDAYAVTGYFGLSLGNEKADVVKQWIAESRAAAKAEASAQSLDGTAYAEYVETHQFDDAVTRAAAELRSGAETGDMSGSLDQLLHQTLPYHATVAAERGLDLVMYEGGTHVVGIGDQVNDEELTDFFTHLNYTPEMGDLYRTLLDGWKDVGGTIFNAFVDVAAPSKWGSWGALRTLNDENPRWDALMDFNAGEPAWWETRGLDVFDHGVVLAGTAGADTLEGTVEEDILLGLAGDDVLIGNGKSDRLHGGDGNDTAILPGRLSDFSFSVEDDALIAQGSDGTTRLVDVETILFADDPGASLSSYDFF